MTKLSEGALIEAMRKSYYSRILEVLGESDVRDRHGNIVIQPGLKVRHKDSQFEYTVASVQEDGDKVVITLQNPEAARFYPAPNEEVLGEESPISPVSQEDVAVSSDTMASGYDDSEVEIFVVDEKEFEKDYEVK